MTKRTAAGFPDDDDWGGWRARLTEMLHELEALNQRQREREARFIELRAMVEENQRLLDDNRRRLRSENDQ